MRLMGAAHDGALTLGRVDAEAALPVATAIAHVGVYFEIVPALGEGRPVGERAEAGEGRPHVGGFDEGITRPLDGGADA